MKWTVKQLLDEIAAIRVRLEDDCPDDALEMCRQIVDQDDEIYKAALAEYNELLEKERETEGIINWEDWVKAYRPIMMEEFDDPQAFGINDLYKRYSTININRIWSLIVENDSYYLKPGLKVGALEYYVTEYPGDEKYVAVFVRDANDEIDRVNRNNLSPEGTIWQNQP